MSLKLKLPALPVKPAGEPSKGRKKFSEDDKNILIEEHVILRLPKGDPLASKLREVVKKRKELPSDFNITWKDARRGIMKIWNETLFVRLVDLPCIIESQKTIDRKHFFKIADISQLIIVERMDPQTLQMNLSTPTRTEDFIYNSGVTPPLKYCRLRRFRKRVNRRRVESIEAEVERLLKEDEKATAVENIMLEPHELEERLAALLEEQEPEEFNEDETNTQVDDKEESDDESVDSELAAELEDEITRAVDEGSSGDEGDIGDIGVEENEADQEDVIEEDLDEEAQALVEKQRMLREEMKDLEEKISEKQSQRNKSVNVLMQKRFDQIISKLRSEQALKESQLMELDLKVEEARQEARDFQAEQQKQQQQQPPPSAMNDIDEGDQEDEDEGDGA